MLWRSVVGKLWVTILLLVSVVLLFITILLLQFFENFHKNEVEIQMTGIANKISEMVAKSDNRQEALTTASEIIDAFSTRAVIIGGDSLYWISPETNDLPSLQLSVFKKDPKLSKVITEDRTVTKQGDFLVMDNGKETYNSMMIVGVPLNYFAGEHGAVYVFQSLDVIEQTTDDAKKIIYISAGIAIILTTIFAFFLSTRITAPLRKMREAAIQVARGKFDTKVPVVTRDEIGELAMAFNRMGRKLQTNLTALNQEKEQLSGVLSSMADGVMTFDKEGKVLVTNPPADRFIRDWFYQMGMHEVFSDELPDEVKTLFHRVVSLEKEQITEVMIQGRSWVILMTPLYDQSIVRGAVAVLRDMTEERRLDELRKGFIANVSHELRTPISLLQGYSEAIVDDIAGSEEDKRDIARIIYDESLRMGRLVNELLDLARLETGQFQLNKNQIGLNDFLSRVVRKFQGAANEHDVTLTFMALDHDETVQFDPDRIEQVITNLIDNALRHTLKDDSVTVSAKSFSEGIRINIKDSGSGISEEDLPFVFERFYKADKARTRGKAGTGLGLAIAKNIVEAHEGQMMVHSKVGEGTTFTIFIPRNLKNPKVL